MNICWMFQEAAKVSHSGFCINENINSGFRRHSSRHNPPRSTFIPMNSMEFNYKFASDSNRRSELIMSDFPNQFYCYRRAFQRKFTESSRQIDAAKLLRFRVEANWQWNAIWLNCINLHQRRETRGNCTKAFLLWFSAFTLPPTLSFPSLWSDPHERWKRNENALERRLEETFRRAVSPVTWA